MPSRLVIAAALALSGCVAVPVRTAGPAPAQESLTLAAFERHLGPYGEWLLLAPYGRVWRPTGVGPGWRPYFHGEWQWTDDGWFWDSDEPWGWAVYHYGRWVLDPRYGWLWVPGVDWAPAWVAWRYGDGFVGWAPLGPGVDAWWTDAYPFDPYWWVFVPSASFVGVRVNVVALPPARVPELFPRVRPAPPPGHGVAPAPPRGGPPRPSVEREAGRPVPPVRIVPVPTPDEARARPAPGSLPTYRPAPPPAPRAAPPPPRREKRDEKD